MSRTHRNRWMGAGFGSGEPVRREAPKISRNDLCPCGSGEKFKKCHGAALEDDEGGGGDATA